MSGFRKATKQKKKLVMSIQGVSGAGKTYSALNVATHMCPPGKRVAFIDSERSADLYANTFDFDIDDDFGKFGALNYHPDVWLKKLEAAARTVDENGECIYGVVILDSFSHMWKADGGLIQTVDSMVRRAQAGGKRLDSHSAWKDVDPVYAKTMNSLRNLPFHVIFCLRCKQETERVVENGKTQIKKLGFEPEFRNGFDYDVDVQLVIDDEHNGVPRKHRLEGYLDGKMFHKPGKELAEVLLAWANDGKERIVPQGERPALEVPAGKSEPPPAPKSEPAVSESGTTPTVDPVEFSIATINNAEIKTLEELKAVATKQVNPLRKKMSPEQWTTVMDAYKARQTALAEAAKQGEAAA